MFFFHTFCYYERIMPRNVEKALPQKKILVRRHLKQNFPEVPAM